MVNKLGPGIAVLRILMALGLYGSVYWQVSDRLSHNVFRPSEYFTFFTITSCLISATVLLVSAISLLRKQVETELLSIFRLTVAASMVVVAVIYNALLAGSAPDVRDGNYEWPVLPNLIMHNWMPIVILIEYLLVDSAAKLPLRKAFWVLVYPITWLIFTLIRGSIQGWWPYPFLDPQYGIPNMLKWIGIISAFFIVLATGLLPLQRQIAKIYPKN